MSASLVSGARLCAALSAVGLLLGGCQILSGLDGLQVGETGSLDGGQRSDGVRCDDRADSGAVCDPVGQCGCAADETCQVRAGEPGCFAPGKVKIGSSCEDDADCAEGACAAGLCERYCASDSDCSEGLCREVASGDEPGGEIKACLRSCEFARQRGCAAPAACVRYLEETPGAPATPGDYCAIPTTECVTDQQCDEPSWGTGRCVEGSDAEDCACTSSVPGGSCDLSEQCGCAPGTHCALERVRGAQASVACVDDRATTREPGEACNDEQECPSGHSCWRGVCEKYCTSDLECGAGTCIAIQAPDEVVGVRVCTVACTFATEAECATGTRCVHAPGGLDYCLVPRSPCPFEADGTCDDSTGSRICVDDSDSDDCS